MARGKDSTSAQLWSAAIVTVILSVLLVSGPIIFLCLLVHAWKRKHDEALKSANYNANLWAQSEAQRHETEIEAARLQGELDTLRGCYMHMSQIARHAIKVGEEAADVPGHLRMADDDWPSVLTERKNDP